MDSTPTTFTITPNSSYRLPSDKKYIHVTNATIDSYNSTTGTLVLSNATGDVSINAYCPIKKGELILMDVGNSSTTKFRVVKDAIGSETSDEEYETVVEVLSMEDNLTSTFGTNNTYSDSTLDTYCNSTYYNTLSTTAKSAIVAKSIIQYKYSNVSSAYNSSTHASYASYPGSSVDIITKNVYALDVQDIELYFGGSNSSKGSFSTTELLTMFWNTTSSKSTFPWLRSATASYTTNVWGVRGSFGDVNYAYVRNSYVVRPAFQVDLSKISFSKISSL